MKKTTHFLPSLMSLIALAIALCISCQQEIQVVPEEKITPELKIAGNAEQLTQAMVEYTSFLPKSGIPGLTQVRVIASLWEDTYPADVILKFAGCPGIGVPCDGIPVVVLSWRFYPRGRVAFNVVVPTGAVTGRITLTDNFNGTITTNTDFKIHDGLPTTGLVAFYPFDDNAQDISGNNLHGSTSGMISSSIDRSGNPNSAYYFDGTDDYISMGNPAKLQITGQMTLAAWIRYTSADPVRPIISKTSYAAGFSGYLLDKSWMSGSQTHAFSFGSWPQQGTCIGRPAGAINLGQWTFLTITVDGPLIKSYQNGQLLSTWERGCGLTSTSLGDFMVGKTDAYAPHFFQGNIDNVAVYNHVLTDAEVMQLYQHPN